MKKSVKVTLFAVLAVTLVFGVMLFSGCSSSSSDTTSTTPPPPSSTTYTGTFYSASANGGHIGVFPVTIDPSNTTSPITVNAAGASKINIKGAPLSSTAIVFHDVRFDDASAGGKNATKIYYAAIQSAGTSTTDIGYVDLNGTLTGNNVGKNSEIDIDDAAAFVIAFALNAMDPTSFVDSTTSGRVLYCASGMDSTHYYGYSMSFPAYIDAVPLTAIATAGSHVTGTTAGFTRTYINQIDANAAGWDRILHSSGTFTLNGVLVPNDLGTPPLAFTHGGTNADGSLAYISTNQVAGLSPASNLAGVVWGYIVKTSDLKSAGTTTDFGAPSPIALNLAAGGTAAIGSVPLANISGMNPSKVVSKISVTTLASNVSPLLGTIAYRATWTPDGKYILQSGNDRVIILSTGATGTTLSLYADTAAGVATPVTGTFATAISSGLGKGTFGGVEVHDVISTPDSKYAIVNLRYFSDAAQVGLAKTSGVQLYDINNKAFIGSVTPTCGANNATSCHPALADFANRPTCGILFKSN